MISVIVPIYKVELYMRKCIQSVLNQTYRNIEILLVDDGSPDHCGEICDEYARNDPRIRVFHISHQGLSVARNIGINEARGEYIGFVDSDDWIEPDMFEILLNALEDQQADVCTCGFWICEGNKELPRVFTRRTYTNTEAMVCLYNWDIDSAVWNKLYRRKIFKDNIFPEGKYYEDIATQHYLISRASKVVVIDSLLYHYQKRNDSITKSLTVQNLIDYVDAFMNRFEFYTIRSHKLINCEDCLFFPVANAISSLWRRWYGCDIHEKRRYDSKIKDLNTFVHTYIPLFGYPSWPIYLRLSSFFMHSDSHISFATLYFLNQLYRKFHETK